MTDRPMRQEVIKMRREKRNGRDTIVLEGFYADVNLKTLASDLKQKLGTGGTVREFAIEIQGDHRDTIAAFLLERGFRSKRAGG